ncbi:MAG: hypothetical protein AB8C46_22520 [Burkholderiaceae bacterium]
MTPIRFDHVTNCNRTVGLALRALACTAIAGLAGCATIGWQLPAAEPAAFHVFNHTGSPLIVMPRLVDAQTGAQLYANLGASDLSNRAGRSGSWIWSESAGATRPTDDAQVGYGDFGQALAGRKLPSKTFAEAPASEPLMLPRPSAGAFQAMANLSRIPDSVVLSWREPALPGQQRFKGQLHGPYRLALRGAVPAGVMARLIRSQDHLLEVAIGASARRPIIVWRLKRQQDGQQVVVARGSVDAVRFASAESSQ